LRRADLWKKVIEDGAKAKASLRPPHIRSVTRSEQ
jgi:hypothetical protein